MLQAGSLWVRVSKRSLEFSIGPIPAALQPGADVASDRYECEESAGVKPGRRVRLRNTVICEPTV
jgi:hypothetical protein